MRLRWMATRQSQRRGPSQSMSKTDPKRSLLPAEASWLGHHRSDRRRPRQRGRPPRVPSAAMALRHRPSDGSPAMSEPEPTGLASSPAPRCTALQCDMYDLFLRGDEASDDALHRFRRGTVRLENPSNFLGDTHDTSAFSTRATRPICSSSSTERFATSTVALTGGRDVQWISWFIAKFRIGAGRHRSERRPPKTTIRSTATLRASPGRPTTVCELRTSCRCRRGKHGSRTTATPVRRHRLMSARRGNPRRVHGGHGAATRTGNPVSGLGRHPGPRHAPGGATGRPPKVYDRRSVEPLGASPGDWLR